MVEIMDNNLFSQEEMLEKTGVSQKQLREFEKAGLFSPAGKTGGDTPVYDRENLTELPKIVALVDLGYSFAEIKRITKKVGLPRTARRKSQRNVPYLTVGELARNAEVSARTIKYWEEKEIFSPHTRSEGGFRLYPEQYILFCKLIKDLQNFGYRLEEIREVADMFREFYTISLDLHHFSMNETRGKLERMKTKIAELKSRMNGLKSGIKRWEQYTIEKSREIERFLGHLLKEKRKKETVKKKKQKKSEEEPSDFVLEAASDME